MTATIKDICGRPIRLLSPSYRHIGLGKRLLDRLGISSLLKNPAQKVFLTSFSFIPNWKGLRLAAKDKRYEKKDILASLPEIRNSLEDYFKPDPNNNQLLIPLPDLRETIDLQIKDKGLKARFLKVMNIANIAKIEITSEKDNKEIREILMPTEILGWDAYSVCRKYRYDFNFAYILGRWIFANVPETDQRRAFIALFGKWGTKHLQGENYSLLLPRRTLSEMLGFAEGSLLRNLIEPLFSWRGLKITICTTAVLSSTLFVAPRFIGRYRRNAANRNNPAVAALKIELKKLESKTNEELFTILEKEKDHNQIIAATKILARRAARSGLRVLAPGGWEKGKILEKPILVRHNPKDPKNPQYLKFLFNFLDPENQEVVNKNVKWVLLTPNVRTGIKPEKSYEIYGNSLGDGVISICTKDPDRRYRSFVAMAAALTHEAIHEKNRSRSLSLLQDELECFEGALKTIRYALDKRAEKIDPSEMAELKKMLAAYETRVKIGKYLSRLGKDFDRVYPQNHILPRILLEAGIPAETLKKYAAVRTDDASDLDRQMQIAVRLALIVLTQENPQLKINEIIRKGSLYEKWAGQSAIDYLERKGAAISLTSRMQEVSALPPHPSQTDPWLMTYHKQDYFRQIEMIREAIDAVHSKNDASQRNLLLELSSESKPEVIAFINHQLADRIQNPEGFISMITLLADLLQKERTSHGDENVRRQLVPAITAKLGSLPAASRSRAALALKALEIISADDKDIPEIARKWIAEANTASTLEDLNISLFNLEIIAGLPAADKEELLKATIEILPKAIRLSAGTGNPAAISFCLQIINQINAEPQPILRTMLENILSEPKFLPVHLAAAEALVKASGIASLQEAEALFNRLAELSGRNSNDLNLQILKVMQVILRDIPRGAEAKLINQNFKARLESMAADEKMAVAIRREAFKILIEISSPEEIEGLVQKLLRENKQPSFTDLASLRYLLSILELISIDQVSEANRREISGNALNYLLQVIEAGEILWGEFPGDDTKQHPPFGEPFTLAINLLDKFTINGDAAVLAKLNALYENSHLPVYNRIDAAIRYLRRTPNAAAAMQNMLQAIPPQANDYHDLVTAVIYFKALSNNLELINKPQLKKEIHDRAIAWFLDNHKKKFPDKKAQQYLKVVMNTISYDFNLITDLNKYLISTEIPRVKSGIK